MYRSIVCLALVAACSDGGTVDAPPAALLHDRVLVTAEDTALVVDVGATAEDARTGALSIAIAPTHGTLTADGPTWTYMPALNYAGGDTMLVRLQSSRGSASATVTIIVVGVGDAPVANPDSFAIGFAAPLTIAHTTLLANDTDVDSAQLTVIGVGAATHGVVVMSGSNVVFTPDIGYAGAASFEYTISDGTLTARATVAVSIGADEAPVATDDTATTDEDVVLVIQDAALLANDTDPEGQTLAISAVGGATHGTVVHAGTQITFTPEADYNGAAGFTYTVTDGYLTDVATVTIAIASVNDLPVAVPDVATTSEDTAVTVPAAVLTANDTDVDGDALTVSAVTATATTHGSVTLSGGLVTYTPDADYNGTASFSYTVSDGNGGDAVGTVTVTITAVNAPPTTVADTGTTDEDTAFTVAGSVLAGNDSDLDGDTLTVTAVAPTATTHGTVSLAGGIVTYMPEPDYNGPADFTYTVSDGNGGTATGSVSISVAPVNDPPVIVASSGTVTYVENAAAIVLDANLSLTDIDSTVLAGATVAISTGCTSPQDVLALPAPPPGITVTGYAPASCTLTMIGAASPAIYQAALRAVTYANTSEAPAATARVVTFAVDDGAASTNTASDTRNLAVTPVDDAPVAVSDTASVTEDALATAIDVLANDTDVDGGPRAISAVTQPPNGTVVITGGGTGLTYAPNANFCNTALLATVEAFAYTLSPGGSVTTVTVTVTCVDDPPVAVADSATVAEGSTGNIINVLVNDTDVDGGPKTIASITPPAHGTATISGDGLTISYAPAAGYCNEAPNAPRDTLTYALAPGGSSATVSLLVTCACGQNKTTDFVVGSN